MRNPRQVDHRARAGGAEGERPRLRLRQGDQLGHGARRQGVGDGAEVLDPEGEADRGEVFQRVEAEIAVEVPIHRHRRSCP